MPFGPSDPETFQGDDDAAELSQETPEANAAEKHTGVRLDRDEPLTRVDPDAANEADAVEQARVVALDEDNYR